MTQFSVSGVAVEFGATRLFSDVTFTVARGEKWGVIGRNGSGNRTAKTANRRSDRDGRVSASRRRRVAVASAPDGEGNVDCRRGRNGRSLRRHGPGLGLIERP